MAISLEITYTPEIAECHIVFFRLTPEGEDSSPVCQYTDTTTSVVNVPKTITIDFGDYTGTGECLEDYEEYLNKCSAFSIEYSVVPCCDGELHDFNFTIDYLQPCKNWEVACTGAKCNDFNFVDCNGNTTPLVFTLLSSVVYVCSKTAPTQYPGVDSPYIITEATPNNCCDCQNYLVKNIGILPLTFYYINCTGTFITSVLAIEENITVCAQGGAPFTSNPNNAQITLLGPC